MIDPTLLTLQAALTGTWDSPIMTLELFGHGESNVSTGKVQSANGGPAMDFDYQTTSDGEKFFLTLTTPMTGAMEYEISSWSADRLSLIKKGYTTVTEFKKR